MDTKNLFLREVSWIQMNKDNLRNASSKDTETVIATKLSNILDQSDLKGDDQLSKDVILIILNNLLILFDLI